jgi:group I intron endonuclease
MAVAKPITNKSSGVLWKHISGALISSHKYTAAVVYKITNKKNNKIYIGSAVNWHKRVYVHLDQLQNNNHFNKHLQSAWNKYKGESFIFEVLEYNDSKLDIINKEQYYLDVLSPWNKKIGYNTCKVAGSSLGIKRSIEVCKKKFKPVLQFSLTGELIKEWESALTATKALKLKKGTISTCISSKCKRKVVKDSFWFLKNNFSITKLNNYISSYKLFKNKTQSCKKVGQYDINNIKLNEFSSLSVAAKFINRNPSNISVCLDKHNKTCAGYTWRTINN